MDKVKFNYDNIHVGDLVLCGSYMPLAMVIKFFSSGIEHVFDVKIPSHVGIIVEAHGQKLIAEMLKDGLALNSLEKYNKGKFNKYIIDIRRSKVYSSAEKRKRLNEAVFKDVRYTLDYDFKGLLNFVISRVKQSSDRYYCSEYFIHQTKIDGAFFPARFDIKASPADLLELSDWKSINWKL